MATKIITYLIFASTLYIGGAINNSDASILPLESVRSSRNEWRSKRDSSCNIVITQHFTRRVLSPGEAISLHCSASGDRPPRFVWERDGAVITSAIDQRYSIWESLSPGLGVVSGLNISIARVEDGGRYTCRASHGDCRTTYSDYVHVYGPPYIRNLPPIKVQNGQQLTLRCPYYGYPISKIEWEHKGRKISTSTLQHGRYRRQYTRWRRMTDVANEEGVLIVDRVVKEENGDSYICVVYTATGEMARRSFEIQVVEAPELDELRVGSGLKEGQIVQITCNIVSGDPPIYFSWLKDGKKIAPNLKITERSSELFSVLIIKRVSLEHCGRYTCIAMNHVGSINQTADLFINVAPKWVEEPTNTSILVGQRGVIHCNANGYPMPNIHWMKRDDSIGIWRPVLDLAGGGVMSLSNGTFIIEMVSLADEGLYSCNVENGVGLPLNKNIWLTINKPVHFDSLSTNLTAKLGYQAQLICLPLGDHPIRIKWTLNGKPIDFSISRLKLSETMLQGGSQSRIDIQYSETVDNGHYECSAHNPHGIAVYSIYLRILEPPTPPVDVQIESVTSRTAKLSWRDTMREYSQYYSIQYAVWDHTKYVNLTRKTSDVRQFYELRDLQPYSEYKVRIASANQVDMSGYTPTINLRTLQEAPSSSPISVQIQQTENPGELFISWSPPPSDTHNGPIQGYHVKAEPRTHYDIDAAEKVRIVKVLSRKGKMDTILSGLLKNTRYSVTISAFNAAGSGPYSLPVYHNTREGAPEQSPSSVECSGISSTSIRVSWQPISTRGQDESLVGYTVLYNIEDEQWHNMTLTQTEVYLQGLSKFTNYSVNVAGYSNYGVGPYSYPINCATLQDVPGPPAVVKVVALSLTSLIVSWSKPEQANGHIIYYNVYIKPAHSTNSPKSYRVPSQESIQDGYTLELKDLETKSYEVHVTASTSAGEGVRSDIVIRELTNKVCTGSWSLGGRIWSPAKTRLSLQCRLTPLCSNNPVTWYKDQSPLTIQPPLYTLTRDYTLLLHDINQSQIGNYSCIIKTSQGRDVVTYSLYVVHTPESPQLRATPYKDTIHVEWDQPTNTRDDRNTRKILYNLSWKEANGSWEEGFKGKGVLYHTIKGVKCGTQYILRIVAENSVGASTPAYFNVHTLGGVPISPSTVEWFWSNSSHIYIQLSGWDDNGCEITKWDIEYRKYGELVWIRAENRVNLDTAWSQYVPSSFALATLQPAQWYQIKVTASNIAGSQTTVYNYATTTLNGESINPPTEFLDLNLVVITCSSVLVTVCFFACIFILIKRNSPNHHTEYRNSLTAECKSDSGNLTDCQSQTKECDRIYSAPIHMPDSKHELYEISPYAQFALGFRTFGHVENQEPPIRVKASSSNRRYDSETSFQARSESEESDYVSRSATLKSAPRKQRRLPHQR